MTYPNTRTGDFATSIEGGEQVAKRAPKQRDLLLVAFALNPKHGLTDEEAAEWSGLGNTCYWKRCGELRADGLIEFTNQVRPGVAGTKRKVSVITEKGKEALVQ